VGESLLALFLGINGAFLSFKLFDIFFNKYLLEIKQLQPGEQALVQNITSILRPK